MIKMNSFLGKTLIELSNHGLMKLYERARRIWFLFKEDVQSPKQFLLDSTYLIKEFVKRNMNIPQDRYSDEIERRFNFFIRASFPLYYGMERLDAATRLAGYFPEHKTFVMPFGESLPVLEVKRKSSTEIVNALTDDTFFVYNSLKQLTKEQIETISKKSWISSQETFNQLKKGSSKKLYNSGYLTQWSYGHLQNDYKLFSVGEEVSSTAIELQLNKAVMRLSKVELVKEDFMSIITEHDSPETLFYFDTIDIEEEDFIESLSNIQGKFMVITDNDKYIEGFNKKELGFYYPLYMITNFIPGIQPSLVQASYRDNLFSKDFLKSSIEKIAKSTGVAIEPPKTLFLFSDLNGQLGYADTVPDNILASKEILKSDLEKYKPFIAKEEDHGLKECKIILQHHSFETVKNHIKKREHWNLLIDAKEGLQHFVLDENPIGVEEMSFYTKPGKNKELCALAKESKIELKPNTKFNTAKQLTSYLERIMASKMVFLENTDTLKRFKILDGVMEGVWFAEREDIDVDWWVLKKL